MEHEAQLKVMEALQEEAYKGIIRIDAETMNSIGVRPGDIVEIEGARATVGIVDRAYPTDVGQSVIRMDGILRRNAKTGIGEYVKVRKADVKEAKSVQIAPAQKGVMIQADPEMFKRSLLGRAVVKGDIVAPGGARRRRRTMSGSPYEDIFDVFEQGFMGTFGFGGLKFVVVNTNPKGAIIISDQTELSVSSKAIEVFEEKVPDVTYEDIGGLDDELKKIREMVELPLKHPEIFERLGVQPPAGVLLHGPPGSGKTMLAKAVANESDANFLLINGPEIVNKYYGECVAADTQIMTNGIGPITIKDAIHNTAIHKITGINMNTQKVEFLPISDRYDKGIQKTLKISTSRGTIELTPTSKLLTPNNPTLLWTYAKDISIGNSVAMIKDFPHNDSHDLLWLPVTAIEQSENHVYDFTVPKDHNFIANGFVVHNSEKRLREIFEEAEKNAPSIIFIDEIDAIAPKREDTHGEVERRIVSTLLVLLDGLQARGKVVVIAASNRPNSLDPALRRPGRFDRELVIGVPNRKGRLQVLKVHTRNMPLEENVNLEELADITHGFVGADLSALCKEAALSVLRRLIPELKLEQKEKIPREILEKITISQNDFKEALRLVRPSGLREVLIEIPNIGWKDIGGLEQQKQELIEAIEWPIKNPQAFKRLGIKAPKGILMYGPPGTGKTLMAKAAAKESEANFILVKGPELIDMWIGQSEKGVRKIFEKARQAAPTIIFFDEIDSIAPRSGMDAGAKVTERMVNTLLVEMDGLEELNNVVIIAATNRPDILDPALLRPGRFDRLLLLGPPNATAREQIFKLHTKNMPLGKGVDIKKIAEETEGYVGADIEAVCREAALLALRENINAKEVKKENFEEALKRVPASISAEAMQAYTELESDYIKKARAGLVKDIPNYMG